MGMLERVDPELREVIERVSSAEGSLFHRLPSGGLGGWTEGSQLLPLSSEASARRAEAHLLRTFSRELSTWMLRAVFVEWRVMNPLGSRYFCEEPREEKLRWGKGDVAQTCGRLRLSGVLGSGVPKNHRGRRALGALSVLVQGGLHQDQLLAACSLARRLHPYPEAHLFAAQIELGRRRPHAALASLQALDDRRLSGMLKISKRTWEGVAELQAGRVAEASECYDAALREPGADGLLSTWCGAATVALAVGDSSRVQDCLRELEGLERDSSHGLRRLMQVLVEGSAQEQGAGPYTAARERAARLVPPECSTQGGSGLED